LTNYITNYKNHKPTEEKEDFTFKNKYSLYSVFFLLLPLQKKIFFKPYCITTAAAVPQGINGTKGKATLNGRLAVKLRKRW